jgi:hypothetical protein
MIMRKRIVVLGKGRAVAGILVCAAVFAVGTQAAGETFIQDGKGYWWDFDAAGAVVDGRGPTQPGDSVDAFDTAMRLAVQGIPFPDSAQTTALGGRMLVTGPAVLSGLNVTRRAYVPDDPAQGWACFLEYFENPTDSSIAVNVRIFGNLGSDQFTTVTGTSSGDTVFTPADRWVTSNDAGEHHDPNLSFNYWGVDAPVTPDAVFLPASQADYYVQFPGVTVPPHATVILMHFCSQSPDAATAIANAEYLGGLPAAALTGLNAANYGPVINWGIQDALTVSPHALAISAGQQGGPFLPVSHDYTLTNTGTTPLDWTAAGPAWLTILPSSGTGLAGGGSELVSVTINATANGFPPGVYLEAITVTDVTSGAQIVRNLQLTVRERLDISPTTGFSTEGFQGGPFLPADATYTLTNGGTDPLVWSSVAPAWLDVIPNTGSLSVSASAPVTVEPNTGAMTLAPGMYSDFVAIRNDTFSTTQTITVGIKVNERLAVEPTDRFVSRGLQGGPFAPSEITYILRNLASDQAIDWSILSTDTPDWLTVTPNSGTLAASASVSILADVNSTAAGMVVGDYPDVITVHNDTYGSLLTRDVLLRIKDVVYVDKDAAGPTHDGTTWATAFATIQAGIDAAAATKSWVWVADGTYTETLGMAEAVEVYGGFHGDPGGETTMAERDPAANVAVINGSGAGTVVQFGDIADAGIDGFTITGGNATGAPPANSGGGIRCNAADNSNFISGCTIRNNVAALRGAGIYCLAGAAPTISNCLIVGNETDADFGGGIACINSTPKILNSRICNNHGRFGGGIGCIQCSPTIVDCVITGNLAASAAGGAGGGGLFAHDHSSPLIVNCVISGNAAKDWGGGAIFCQTASNAVLTNCTISSNYCNTGASGIQAIAGSPAHPGSMAVLTNCVLEGTYRYAIWQDALSQVTVSHCLFHNNGIADFVTQGAPGYMGGDVINANVTGAHDNVAGDPDPRFVAGITGAWTGVAYNASENTTELTAAGAAFLPGLAGQIINADTAQTRQALILSNSTDMVTVAGNVTSISGAGGYVDVGDTFRIVSYEIESDSPCINVGDNGAPNLPVTDIAGHSRVIQGIVDLGAYESAGATSATVLGITHEGSRVSGQSVLCFEVIFSRAVNSVAISDFVVDGLDGQIGAAIDSVTGHDYRWEVCVDTGAGNGALTVDLVDSDHSITDVLGYVLAAGYDSDPLSQAAYYVDHLTITTQPEGGNKVTGESHAFLVQAEGGTGTLHYLWLRNGSPIPEASDSPGFAIDHLALSDDGTYTCDVADDYTVVVSNPAVLVVTQKVPVAGMVGIGMIVAAIGVSAARGLRRRK